MIEGRSGEGGGGRGGRGGRWGEGGRGGREEGERCWVVLRCFSVAMLRCQP